MSTVLKNKYVFKQKFTDFDDGNFIELFVRDRVKIKFVLSFLPIARYFYLRLPIFLIK